ncbi:hypothetical protein BT63DRAFT_449122 [Microthyrium microscopicum]|uniref:Rhodopsin domain-containing protein n=1 Tax=Microthyrium microscopicum TaxID=703497 RepID=A0A6A6UT72_9PEZI|nr:hypothetical protein BT63DRAFT_449122 [Microthyrium microscopicum]
MDLAMNLPFIKRSLYSDPPPGSQSKFDNNPTLLFSWFCTISTVVIILVRLMGRKLRTNELFPEDKVMFLSMIPLLIRMALIHVVMIWGTNNYDISRGLTDQEIYQRSIGSRLVLAARVFYAMFIWTAKFTVSEFLKRLAAPLWTPRYQMFLHGIRIFLCASFVGVVIAILSECQPVDHYWQVVPDPGPHCRQAYAQLFTMATADIITDILLLIFPLTILLPASGMPLLRRVKLGLLFILSGVNIIVTAWRVVSVVQHQGLQQRRTVYASGEILAAAAASNAVILGSFLRDRGVKKPKWRSSLMSDTGNNTATGTRAASTSTGDAPNSPRRQTISRLDCGSDEDLFSGMCYRSDLARAEAGEETPAHRPARPVLQADISRHTSASPSPASTSRRASSKPRRKASTPALSPLEAMRPLVKTVTFSDPGGLLARASSRASTLADEDIGPTDIPPSNRQHVRSMSDTSTRAGTPATLQDVGGLLGDEEDDEEWVRRS